MSCHNNLVWKDHTLQMNDWNLHGWSLIHTLTKVSSLTLWKKLLSSNLSECFLESYYLFVFDWDYWDKSIFLYSACEINGCFIHRHDSICSNVTHSYRKTFWIIYLRFELNLKSLCFELILFSKCCQNLEICYLLTYR